MCSEPKQFYLSCTNSKNSKKRRTGFPFQLNMTVATLLISALKSICVSKDKVVFSYLLMNFKKNKCLNLFHLINQGHNKSPCSRPVFKPISGLR